MTAAVDYCSKDETRTGKLWTKGIARPPKDYLIDPYPWQKQIITEIYQEPDNRTINWIYETQGNTGKTTLARHLAIHGKCIYVTGKASDIKYAITQMIEQGQDIPCVIWDISRTQEQYVSYTAIEEIKNGYSLTQNTKQNKSYSTALISTYSQTSTQTQKLYHSTDGE